MSKVGCIQTWFAQRVQVMEIEYDREKIELQKLGLCKALHK